MEREIALDPACVDDKELIVPEKNMLAMAAIAEAGAGLAFVSGGGLHEAAALDDEVRTLAVTLLRGFQRPVATDGQPGGQIVGEHEFSFAIAPFAGPGELPALLSLRDQLASGVRVRQTDDGFGAAQRSESLLRLRPAAVRLSALKPAADGRGWILRLYNPAAQDETAEVEFAFPLSDVIATNLNEDDGESLGVSGTAFEVAVPAKKIVTLRLIAA